MIIYVDGSDLLEHFAEREDRLVVEGDRDMSRDNLTRWLGRYCEVRDCQAVLVFGTEQPGDVRSPTERFARVKVTNVPYGGDVRTEIGGPANQAAKQERTLVVTADNRLADAVQRGRARVLTPAAFVARARKLMRPSDEVVADEPDEKFTGVTDEEVDFWLGLFGNED